MEVELDEDITGIFNDYIEVESTEGDSFIYSLVFSSKFGFCFRIEEEPLIRQISVHNSKMFLYYINGALKKCDFEVASISIEGDSFKRRYGYDLAGFLVKYDFNMAQKYGLDRNKIETIPIKKLLK